MGDTNVKVTLDVSGDEEPLKVVNGVRRGIEQLQEELRRSVREARKLGHSWQEIADALGTSRQAAWEQFREEAPSRRDVISETLGSLAGPGPSAEEIRTQEREAEAEIEERKWSRG